jgi:hypothetical protein
MAKTKETEVTPQAEPRSIYIVVRAAGFQNPIAAFTDKDALTEWLKGRSIYEAPVWIFIMEDGVEFERADRMTVEQFIG